MSLLLSVRCPLLYRFQLDTTNELISVFYLLGDFSIFDDNLEIFLALDDSNDTVDTSRLKSVESNHSFMPFRENWQQLEDDVFALVLWEIYKQVLALFSCTKGYRPY